MDWRMEKHNMRSMLIWLAIIPTAQSWRIVNAPPWKPRTLVALNWFRVVTITSEAPGKSALTNRNVWSCVPASLYCNVLIARWFQLIYRMPWSAHTSEPDKSRFLSCFCWPSSLVFTTFVRNVRILVTLLRRHANNKETFGILLWN